MDALSGLRVDFLGLKFDNLPQPHALQALLSRPPGARFAYVVTPNADHFVRLKRLPALRPIYDAAGLCLLDSRFLAHAADLLRLARPCVVPGSDLCADLLACLNFRRVAVIGLREADFVALARRYPAIKFLHHEPPRHLLEDATAFAATAQFAAAARADFTFFAVGSPMQELLAAAVARTPGTVGLGLCVGAALEFCAGARPRAPLALRRLGLEWLYRLAREPGRLAGRYLLDDPPILLELARQAWRGRSF